MNQKTQPNQPNRPVFLFRRYKIQQHETKTFGTSDDAREIGKAMARKVAKKLKLNLDI